MECGKAAAQGRGQAPVGPRDTKEVEKVVFRRSDGLTKKKDMKYLASPLVWETIYIVGKFCITFKCHFSIKNAQKSVGRIMVLCVTCLYTPVLALRTSQSLQARNPATGMLF